MIIKSDRIYFEDGVKCGFLEIENGKFKSLSKTSETNNYIDYGNMRVIPGIFDTHNHGTCGYSMAISEDSDLDEETIEGYLKGCASQGITGIFPTVIGKAIGELADAASKEIKGAKILGIHSEGPWLNRVGEKGVKTGWPSVDIEVAKKMVGDSKGLLKLVSLAPEIPGISEVVEYLLSEGVTIGYAHSDLKYEGAAKAFSNGFTVATHLGNVMTGIHHRDIGGLGAALTNDDVWCEVICDGMHICPEMVDIYLRIKDNSHIMIISDCTPFSQAPVGSYRGWFPGMTINVDEDGFVISDTGRLMGSSQPVLYGISVLTEKLNIPLEEVIKMSSLNPCTKYGFDDSKGSIKIGKDADFVVINDDYKCLATYVEGEKMFDKDVDKDLFNPKFFEQMSKIID